MHYLVIPKITITKNAQYYFKYENTNSEITVGSFMSNLEMDLFLEHQEDSNWELIIL